jgi:hypothetical protein
MQFWRGTCELTTAFRVLDFQVSPDAKNIHHQANKGRNRRRVSFLFGIEKIP